LHGLTEAIHHVHHITPELIIQVATDSADVGDVAEACWEDLDQELLTSTAGIDWAELGRTGYRAGSDKAVLRRIASQEHRAVAETDCGGLEAGWEAKTNHIVRYAPYLVVRHFPLQRRALEVGIQRIQAEEHTTIVMAAHLSY
jgi:hypothetical protein